MELQRRGETEFYKTNPTVEALNGAAHMILACDDAVTSVLELLGKDVGRFQCFARKIVEDHRGVCPCGRRSFEQLHFRIHSYALARGLTSLQGVGNNCVKTSEASSHSYASGTALFAGSGSVHFRSLLSSCDSKLHLHLIF